MTIYARFLTAASLILAVSGWVAAPLAAQNSTTLPPLAPPPPSYNFPPKETLNYAVDWRVFPAGTGSIHLEQAGDIIKVNASGETIEALNLLFRVSDKFESSFDRKTGCSYGFSKQTLEGRRQVNTDLKFDCS